MQPVEFKNFRDSKNKLLLSYWTMNKGEIFITCDLSKTSLELGEDNQIEDYGCTFVAEGSFTFQEIGTDTITTVYAGDCFNRRPQKAVLITAIEDNTHWCYSLHVNQNKDLYLANPIYKSELNTITYKSPTQENFTNLNFGKYLRIKKGEVFEIQSVIDTYIPKLYYITSQS
jgi:hypothetical protein